MSTSVQALALQREAYKSKLASGFAIVVLIGAFAGLDFLIVSATKNSLYGFLIWGLFGVMFLFGLVTATKLASSLTKESNMIPVGEAPSAYRQYALDLKDSFSRVATKAGLNPNDFKLFIVKDNSYNAFAAGAGSNRIVAAHTALLRDFTSDEIDGVLAHELAHQRNNDIFLLILANAMILCFVIIGKMLFEVARLMFFVGDDNDRDNNKKGDFWSKIGLPLAFFLLGLLSFAIGYLFAPIAMAFLSRRREDMADAHAVALGFGEGLESAFEKLHRDQKKTKPINRAMASLYINQANLGLIGHILSDHPPIQKRIKRVNKLLSGDQGLVPDFLEYRIRFIIFWVILPIIGGFILSHFGTVLPGFLGIPWAYIAIVAWLYELNALLQNTGMSEVPAFTKTWWFFILAVLLLIVGIGIGVEAIYWTSPLLHFTVAMYVVWGSKPVLGLFSKLQLAKFLGDMATYACILYCIASLVILYIPVVLRFV